jgi:hypothetical protein
MSVGAIAVGGEAISAQAATSSSKPPPKRQVTAKADATAQPEPR